MDTSRKVNANAGKGARYRPGDVAQNFGQPNMAAPGAGISGYARIRSQPHGSARGGTQAPTDKSGSKPTVAPPGMSIDNMSRHPAGVSGPSRPVAGFEGDTDMNYPGDGATGRRGGMTQGNAPDRYRKKY